MASSNFFTSSVDHLHLLIRSGLSAELRAEIASLSSAIAAMMFLSSLKLRCLLSMRATMTRES